MTGAINNLAASLSGNIVAASSAAKAKANETFETAYKRKLIKDEYNARVEETEHIDAVRSLADADQEDAREDRQEHQMEYRPPSKSKKAGRLDLNA